MKCNYSLYNINFRLIVKLDKKNKNIHISEEKINEYCDCVLKKVEEKFTQKDFDDLNAKKLSRERVMYSVVYDNK